MAQAKTEPLSTHVAQSVKLVVETIQAVHEAKPLNRTAEEKANQREAFVALPTTMTLEEQCAELRKHHDTPMTYAEMRARFG